MSEVPAFEVIGAHSEDLVHGFAETNITCNRKVDTDKPDDDWDSLFICGACFTMPRYPVVMDQPFAKTKARTCRHVLCEDCHLQMKKAHQSSNIDYACPRCRLPFRKPPLRYETWNDMAQRSWTQVRILCCWELCGFVSDPITVRKHELFCDYRTVWCPNSGCGRKGILSSIKTHHKVCDFYVDFCNACGFAWKPNTEQDTHNCIALLRDAVAKLYKANKGKMPRDVPGYSRSILLGADFENVAQVRSASLEALNGSAEDSQETVMAIE